MTRMTRLVAALGMLLVATPSYAVLISVTGADGTSNIDITEGTSTVDVYVRIQAEASDTTSNEIASLNYTFVVGDGGPVTGTGTDIVPITAVTYTGTGTGREASVWDGVSGLEQSATFPLPTTSANVFSVNSDTAGENGLFDPTIGGPLTGLTGPTVLARLTLDTSGLTAGESFGITVFSGFAPPTADRFIPDGGTLSGFNSQTISNINFGGDALLTVSAVPEPGSFGLLSLGIAAFGARRRFRRRRTELAT